MSQTDPAAAASPPPRDETGSGAPTFDEPWQAQLLALADALTRGGVFTPTAWSEALGGNLRRAAESGAPDTPASYYAAVLETLEELLTRSGAVTRESLAARREAWRQSYLTTPHGQPVELAR